MGLQNNPKCYPFVKWPGGKRQLISQLTKYLPSRFCRYFEPFLGGGALYFHLSTGKELQFEAFLSDANTELVNAYTVVRDSVSELIKILKYHQQQYTIRHKYYYELRDHVRPLNRIESAARFIALNKTCFNGLFRVNKKGIFNVPIGTFKKNPLICDVENLMNVSRALNVLKPRIFTTDYEKILIENTEEGDFIYLDPPYTPVSSTAYFTAYTNEGYSAEEQRRLANIFKKLDGRHCNVLLSNSDTPYIRKLYEKYSDYMVSVQATRAINSKATNRSGHRELLIRNYH